MVGNFGFACKLYAWMNLAKKKIIIKQEQLYQEERSNNKLVQCKNQGGRAVILFLFVGSKTSGTFDEL